MPPLQAPVNDCPALGPPPYVKEQSSPSDLFLHAVVAAPTPDERPPCPVVGRGAVNRDTAMRSVEVDLIMLDRLLDPVMDRLVWSGLNSFTLFSSVGLVEIV